MDRNSSICYVIGFYMAVSVGSGIAWHLLGDWGIPVKMLGQDGHPLKWYPPVIEQLSMSMMAGFVTGLPIIVLSGVIGMIRERIRKCPADVPDR